MLPWFTLLASATAIFSWVLIIYSYLCHCSNLWFILSPYPAGELIALLALILFFVFYPGVCFSIAYWRETKTGLCRSLLIGLIVPVYNILQIPAVLIAFYRQLIGIRSWAKTDH
jgi:hypothetical protein